MGTKELKHLPTLMSGNRNHHNFQLNGLENSGKLPLIDLTIYRNAALCNSWTINFAHKGIYLHPNKREDRGQQHWPQNNNGWSPVLATHETLEEGVEMNNHPEGKEHLAKEWSPWIVSFVKCIRKSSNNTHHIDDDKSRRRDQNCCPFDKVELTKLSIVGCFWSDCEVGIKASQHLQESLENSKEMGWNASNDPKLLITPPLLNADTTPPQLKHTCHDDGNEKPKKQDTCDVGKLNQIPIYNV